MNINFIYLYKIIQAIALFNETVQLMWSLDCFEQYIMRIEIAPS